MYYYYLKEIKLCKSDIFIIYHNNAPYINIPIDIKHDLIIKYNFIKYNVPTSCIALNYLYKEKPHNDLP